MVADQSGDICGATHNAAALLDVIIRTHRESPYPTLPDPFLSFIFPKYIINVLLFRITPWRQHTLNSMFGTHGGPCGSYGFWSRRQAGDPHGPTTGAHGAATGFLDSASHSQGMGATGTHDGGPTVQLQILESASHSPGRGPAGAHDGSPRCSYGVGARPATHQVGGRHGNPRRGPTV